MDFEPQKFFISLMDFFTILLPGAIITVLLKGNLELLLVGSDKYSLISGNAGWGLFFISSYLLGHLVAIVGSRLDILDSWVNRHNENSQIKMLANGQGLSPRLVRKISGLVMKPNYTEAINSARKLKHQSLSKLQAEYSINTFQWCKSILISESPESYAVVQRFEADAKFFRSFFIILCFLLYLLGSNLVKHHTQSDFLNLLLLPPLIMLTLLRYMEQRFKAIYQAFCSVITLQANKGMVLSSHKSRNKRMSPFIGCLVFRVHHNQVQFLLFESQTESDRWELPKGSITGDENEREAAVRIVLETTGIWAKIDSKISPSRYDNEMKIQFFLMKYIERDQRASIKRQYSWNSLAEVQKKVNSSIVIQIFQEAEAQ